MFYDHLFAHSPLTGSMPMIDEDGLKEKPEDN